MLFRQARLAEVPPWIDRAVTDSEEAEFLSGLATPAAIRGGLNLYRGRWDAAEAELRSSPPPTSQGPHLAAPRAARPVAPRRGEPGAAPMLDRAEAGGITGFDDPQRLFTVRAARVEHAWWPARRRRLGRGGGDARHGRVGIPPSAAGELLRYVQRAGGTAGPWRRLPLP